MKIQVLQGVDGVCFGDRREDIAKKYGKRYREFGKHRCPTNLVGSIDRRVFIHFDKHDLVEFFDVAEPTHLVDETGAIIPLVYGAFMVWATGHTTRLEYDTIFVPSISLAATFQMEDDGTLPDSAIARIASIGISDCFDESYFNPLSKRE